eukprot:TRINITY_DN64817_c0_g1_i1.p1 TRINITY_DN64817_c0_g1~~TRINITY_DN64817_c0_g1_i1.p1  ORF type:complete len:587 (-),score=126.60 TRINITY_DN64817_c0_g1_i1:273-2033(-)
MASEDASKSAVVSAFARVRPVSLAEAESGEKAMPELELTLVEADGSAICPGFSALLGQEAKNQDVFERALAPHVQQALRGGSVSLMCFGAKASGKTHTAFGSNEEKGMHILAVERLLADLSSAGDDQLALRISACELFDDTALDVLGEKKLPCSLEIGSAGHLAVIPRDEGQALSADETGTDLLGDEKPDGLRSTVIVRQCLRTATISKADDIDKVPVKALQQRLANAASSSSHAVVRLEITSSELEKAQLVVDDARALLQARKNAVENVKTSYMTLLADANAQQHRVLRAKPSEAAWKESQLFLGLAFMSEDAKEIATEGVSDDGSVIVTLKGHEAEDSKSLQDWAKHFDVSDMTIQTVVDKRKYEDPGKWEAARQILLNQAAKLNKLLDDADTQLKKAQAAYDETRAKAPAGVGGSVLIVDLASMEASAAVDKTLDVLKECMAAMSKSSLSKAKCKENRVTHFMEENLLSRKGSEAVAVLVVHLASAEKRADETLKALNYGQICVNVEEEKRSKTVPQKKLKGGEDLVPAQCDPKVKEEIVAIYKEHCPEKTEQDVQIILYRFAGRENELLQKAREKYTAKAGA